MLGCCVDALRQSDVLEDVTTDQCLAWLANAGFDGQCHKPDGVPPEVSFVLARCSP